MTDDEVETRVLTPSEELTFEEFFVLREAADPVEKVSYSGVDDATPAPGVLEQIDRADLLVLGPSNPVSSVGTILALRGVRQAIERSSAPVVAITPVVSNLPITNPDEARQARCRESMLRSWGLPHRALSVARLYRDLADVFVLDTADSDERDAIEALGLDLVIADTVVTSDRVGDALAALLISLVR
jgi:LPPG:FO 2-phospho-L-lactate transferase